MRDVFRSTLPAPVSIGGAMSKVSVGSSYGARLKREQLLLH